MQFQAQAKKMHVFMKKFKEHIDGMESDFEQAVIDNNQVNAMLKTFEGQMAAKYKISDALDFKEEDLLVFESPKNEAV